MPLPEPDVARDEAHLRDITLRGFHRADGLFDIEGRLLDRKPVEFQVMVGPLVAPMAPIPDVSVRMTIDLDYRVVAIVGVSDTVPYKGCHEAPPNLAGLVGASIADGWGKAVRTHFGGVRGCSHLFELLQTLGSVAFQTLIPLRRHIPEVNASGTPPFLLNNCIAFHEEGAVAPIRWPSLYENGRLKRTD